MVGYKAKDYFFQYDNKNYEKEYQIEVTMFRNSTSVFSLFGANWNMFISKQGCFGKLRRGLPYYLHFKWSTLVLWNKYKQAKNAQGKTHTHTHTSHIFNGF